MQLFWLIISSFQGIFSKQASDVEIKIHQKSNLKITCFVIKNPAKKGEIILNQKDEDLEDKLYIKVHT